MINREKVIKAFEICYTSENNCTVCPLFQEDDCNDKLMRDVLSLLKEQEPRVLTLEEVKKLQSIRDGAIWLEVFGNGLFPALPEFSNKSITFFVAILFEGYRSVFENDWYGITWRCWSTKPNEKQMEAVPWQD